MTDVSTNGWDVVSITDLDTINKIINADKLYPSDFSQVDSDAGDDISISGKWGAWTVTNNASGAKVNIRCEIAEGTTVYNNENYDLNGSSGNSFIEIELSLKGISTVPEKWASSDDTVVDSTSCYQLMADADSPVIIADSFFTGIESHVLQLLLPELLKEWFNSNIDKFKQIFSVILIGLEAGNSDFQWLYPSAYSYAANSSLDGNTTGFGVLTLVDGKTDAGSLQQSVDIQALDLVKKSGGNLALVISKAMFVKHMLLDAAVSIVKGSARSDFTISDTGLSLHNNREMVWQDFENGEGGTFSPVLPEKSFSLTLQSDAIELSIIGAHYRHGGMCTVFMGVTQSFRFKVEKNASGEPVFVPDESGLGNAMVSCSVKFDNWVNVLEISMGVITGLAAVIGLGTVAAGVMATRMAATLLLEEGEELAVFSANTAEIGEVTGVEAEGISNAILRGIVSNPTVFNAVKIGSLIMGSLSGITMVGTMISAAIYKSEYDDVPSFHSFARAITGSAVWPNIKNTELKSASLADSFVIGLELK
ncbi:TULIP family P47-like protein [Klebsiella variicola]